MKINSVIFALLAGDFFSTSALGQDGDAGTICTIDGVRRDERWGWYLLPPSQFVECVKQVSVNHTNFIQYVNGMNQIYDANFAFYHTAIDASSNEPDNHQSELGYQIYHGPNEGTMDINAQSQELIDAAISAEAADASMFWDVNEIYQLLRDAHITVTESALGGLSSSQIGGDNAVALYLQSYFDTNNQTYGYRSVLELEDGEVVLSIQESNIETGEIIGDRRVQSINDQTPGEFLEFLANTPLFNVKSLGARANAAMGAFGQGFITGSTPDTHIFFAAAITSPDIFPDEMPIVFENGDTDTVLAYIWDTSLTDVYGALIDNDNSLALDIASIEEDINTPGALFTNMDNIILDYYEGLDACALPPPVQRRVEFKPELKPRRRVQEEEESIFDGIFLNCSRGGEGGVWTYAIMDGYAVLKFAEGFPGPESCGAYDETNFTGLLTSAWKEFVDTAVENEANNLIVDLSGNGGGWPMLGVAMSMMMFPEVEYEHFITWDSVPYNDAMHEFETLVNPYLGNLLEAFLDRTEEDQQQYLQTRSNEYYCEMQQTLELYENFFTEDVSGIDLGNFSAIAADFLELRTVDAFNALLDELIDLHQFFNPWTVTSTGGVALETNRTTPETVIRGGVEAQFVRDFDAQFIDMFPDITAFLEESMTNSFDEYIVLSNGACGSSCDIFATTVQQIWRNRDVTGAEHPLSVVTYGGLGEPLDASQFAGGFVENPLIEANYAPLLSLFFTGHLLNLTEDQEFWKTWDTFNNATPDIPYFANNWPAMPVTEGINGLMMPSGIPIEYLKKAPDFYIAQMFNNPGDPVELAELYRQASDYFGVEPEEPEDDGETDADGETDTEEGDTGDDEDTEEGDATDGDAEDTEDGTTDDADEAAATDEESGAINVNQVGAVVGSLAVMISSLVLF